MTLTHDSTREIYATRTYKATPDQLIRMWANPEHLTHWWGPIGFSTTTHQMEFRAGGLWKFTMHGPDGTAYPNVVRYTKVSPNQIEYEHKPVEGLAAFKVSVSFEQQGEFTKMGFRMTFPSVEDKQMVEDKAGAEEGLSHTLSRLDGYVAEQNNDIELVIVRRFDAPLAKVWSAFTVPEQLAKWSAPPGMTIEEAVSDIRVGGKWHVKMSMMGFSMLVEGEYLEINPMDKLVYTHRWLKEDGTYKPTTTITIRFHEHEGKTTMTFVQSGFWSEEARAAHLGGWTATFIQLGDFVGAVKKMGQVSITREFKAPIGLVWDCWTNPENLSKWFAPKPYTCPQCTMDLRPGGEFNLVMRSPEGMEHLMSAEIVELETKQSLGWVFELPDETGEPHAHGANYLFFEDLGSTTKVTVNAIAGALTDAGVYMVSGMEPGWNMTLDQLGETLS